MFLLNQKLQFWFNLQTKMCSNFGLSSWGEWGFQFVASNFFVHGNTGVSNPFHCFNSSPHISYKRKINRPLLHVSQVYMQKCTCSGYRDICVRQIQEYLLQADTQISATGRYTDICLRQIGAFIILYFSFTWNIKDL